MAVFAIMSEKPQPELQRAVERVFAQRYLHWSDTVSFVRSNEDARSVSINLGIKYMDGQNQPVGSLSNAAVVQLAPNYFGWSSQAGWEWLKTSFEASD